MDNFVSNAITTLNTYKTSTSSIYARSLTKESPLGKKAYSLLAWFMSGLLLPTLVVMLVVALIAFANGTITVADLAMFKDMFTVVGHVFLASTWVNGSYAALYLLGLAWDDLVWGTAGSIWKMIFKG